MPSPVEPQNVLVLGATGATGRHVVHNLLRRGRVVRVIVRSKRRFDAIMSDLRSPQDNLHVTEASITEMADAALSAHLADSDVVSCLGHRFTFAGFGGRLVRNTTERVTSLMATRAGPAPRFVLMSSVGVCHPAGCDGKRSFAERVIFWLLRRCVPPHADNEESAALLCENFPPDLRGNRVQWVVVRPTTLVDRVEAHGDLIVSDRPPASGAFGKEGVARASVGKFMADILSDGKMWDRYCFQMPVVYEDDEIDMTTAVSNKKK